MLFRSFVVWLGIAAAEVVHGTIRSVWLAPVIGDLPSRQWGVLSGSLIILLIAYATSRWIGARGTGGLLAVGMVWVVLMAGFEAAVGRSLGLSWERIVSDYLPWRGGFMLFGMAVLALAPLLAATARERARGDPQR